MAQCNATQCQYHCMLCSMYTVYSAVIRNEYKSLVPGQPILPSPMSTTIVQAVPDWAMLAFGIPV